MPSGKSKALSIARHNITWARLEVNIISITCQCNWEPNVSCVKVQFLDKPNSKQPGSLLESVKTRVIFNSRKDTHVTGQNKKETRKYLFTKFFTNVIQKEAWIQVCIKFNRLCASWLGFFFGGEGCDWAYMSIYKYKYIYGTTRIT